MAITDIDISETLETNAPSIKYRGNEGPKSPQEEQMIMEQQQMAAVDPMMQKKLKLIEELQKLLDETTRLKQLERQNQEAQQTQETFYKVPYPIYVG